jgi:prephenate dehydratase
VIYMRVGYLGPEGTFAHEALLEAGGGDAGLELVPLPGIFDSVMAVQSREVDVALVPIENSLEGSVNVTLDALAFETSEVRVVGERVLAVHHCLIARDDLELGAIETVLSHPQATAQCARFVRTCLPAARVVAAASTADAVRTVAEHGGGWAALGPRRAAERYGCRVLRAGVEDLEGNETRFVWLAHRDAEVQVPGRAPTGGQARGQAPPAGGSGFKTAVVFWGAGSQSPGWLVGCLNEFAAREVNLTRIESRPRRQRLGEYIFFADLEGSDDDPAVAEALAGLGERVEVLRILGSYPAA